jgi:hypothetical protein
MFLAFTALLTIVLYLFLTSKYPGADDFYQRWRSAYGFWHEGRDVYSKEASLIVEMDMFGHPARNDPTSDEYPGDFVYPFNFALLLAPLTLVPYPVAEAIWLALTAAALSIAFILCADLYAWRPEPWLLALGIIWAVTFYPAARGIFLGQPGTLAVCLQIIAIWALSKQRDILAGVTLGLTTYKPQLGLLLFPFLILWALRYSRWRFIVSFALCSGILLGLSLLIFPQWLGEWLAQLNAYNGYTLNGSPIYAITNYYLPFLGHPVELAITVVLVGAALWSWAEMLWRRDNSMFNWTVAYTLTITHLVLVRTATPHFVVFFLVIVFYFRQLYRVKHWLVPLAMIVLSFGLWWLFLTTLSVKFENQINYLPLPWGTFILLLLTRKQWRQHELVKA